MVGRNIGKYLEENGIKQSYLAEKVGVTPAKMSNICKRDKMVDSVTYYRICKVLNVPFERFMEG